MFLRLLLILLLLPVILLTAMETMKAIDVVLHETQQEKSSALTAGPGAVGNDVTYGQVLILPF